MSLARSTLAFRWVFVAFIVIASARTVIDTGHIASDHSSLGIVVLGTSEIAAALLFLLRRTQIIGLLLLLMIFAIATTLSLLEGELPYRFAYYAASAMFIVAVDRAQPATRVA
jgi:hypothetical protein